MGLSPRRTAREIAREMQEVATTQYGYFLAHGSFLPSKDSDAWLERQELTSWKQRND